ncbi:MAG: Sua5/YciO/YrdC/YwlC family protein, partial [Planctomycetaceae bacterium]
MPEVIDIRNTDDFRDVVHRAVHCLSDGLLVAFPTETFYAVAAHALHPNAVAAVRDLSADNPCVLGLKSAEEALAFLPRMSQIARKLARRCWPGPVTIAF